MNDYRQASLVKRWSGESSWGKIKMYEGLVRPHFTHNKTESPLFPVSWRCCVDVFSRVHPRCVHLHRLPRNYTELPRLYVHKSIQRKNVRKAGTLFFPTRTLFFSILCCCFSVRQCLEYLPALQSSKRNIVLQQLVLLSSQWGLFHYDSQYLHVIHSRITDAWLPDNSLCAFILLKVEVDSDCTKIALGQRVAVTVKTVPSYCGIDWRGTYEAPGKSLGRLFPVYLVTGNTNLSFFFFFLIVLLLSRMRQGRFEKTCPGMHQ